MFIEFNMLVCNIGIWKLELFLLLRKTFFLCKALLFFFRKALLLFLCKALLFFFRKALLPFFRKALLFFFRKALLPFFRKALLPFFRKAFLLLCNLTTSFYSSQFLLVKILKTIFTGISQNRIPKSGCCFSVPGCIKISYITYHVTWTTTLQKGTDFLNIRRIGNTGKNNIISS